MMRPPEPKDSYSQMERHHHAVHLPIAPATVASLLGTQPATWLRRFLRLAIPPRLLQHYGGDAPGWYRLPPPQEVEAGALESPLTWWPHAGDELFESFRGSFTVLPTGQETRLTLAGDARGGDPATNEEVLRTLVELLGAALRAAHSPDG